MCHGGVSERALVPERSHTHTCAVRGLRASAPSRVCPSNSHDVNISRPSRVVLRLLHVGYNTTMALFMETLFSRLGILDGKSQMSILVLSFCKPNL